MATAPDATAQPRMPVSSFSITCAVAVVGKWCGLVYQVLGAHCRQLQTDFGWLQLDAVDAEADKISRE